MDDEVLDTNIALFLDQVSQGKTIPDPVPFTVENFIDLWSAKFPTEDPPEVNENDEILVATDGIYVNDVKVA